MHYDFGIDTSMPIIITPDMSSDVRSLTSLLILILLAGCRGDEPGARNLEQTSWETLMTTEFVQVETDEGFRWTPEFTEQVTRLDDRDIRIRGYMIPLDYSDRQTHFLISAWPGDGCFFHLPGGPNSVIEVLSEDGVEFSYARITVQGRLTLLRDGLAGLLYRLDNAEIAPEPVSETSEGE